MFEKLRSSLKIAKDNGNKLQAYCPAHKDDNASLSIKIDGDKALIFCHAGCSIDEVLKAANLTYQDLFLDGNRPTNIYQYRNEDGTLSHEKLKYKTPKGKRFTQRRIDGEQIVDNLGDIKRIPYNYPQVIKATKEGNPILYVEGEKDAETARMLGYVATTMGGASDWKDEYKNFFKKAVVIQIPDKDNAGITLAHNVTKSLTEVCKSLRVAILPQGKDLTEWVELGNQDLSTVIKEYPELITYKGLSEPLAVKTDSGYDFTWNDLNLLIKIQHLSDEAEGIIVVKELSNERTIHTSKINLLSTRSLSELSKRLKAAKPVDWDAILSLLSNRCFDTLSDGGQTVDVSIEPTTMAVEYLLYPILPLYEPVTLFTAGGKGKSTIADFFSVVVSYGESFLIGTGLPFTTPQETTNVLYLDYEADEETHRRYITAIKRGLKIDDSEYHTPIFYRRLEHPLVQIADSIRTEIFKNKIGFVVIDSQMAATASGTRGLTEAQVASEYYNVLRSFKCSTLTIDHITKVGMSSSEGAEAPYGSVVKYNRSRSQFELRLPDENDDDDHKEYALIHRKFNLGRKQKPIGLTLDYSNNGHGELAKIEFSGLKISDSPALSKVLTLKQRLVNELKKCGRANSAQLADAIGEKDKKDSITTTLSRDTKTFVRVGDGVYGLLSTNN